MRSFWEHHIWNSLLHLLSNTSIKTSTLFLLSWIIISSYWFLSFVKHSVCFIPNIHVCFMKAGMWLSCCLFCNPPRKTNSVQNSFSVIFFEWMTIILTLLIIFVFLVTLNFMSSHFVFRKSKLTWSDIKFYINL